MSASSIEGQGEASQDPAVIPFTAPIHDDLGRLTYLGSDGRRYVVADPPLQDGAQEQNDQDSLRDGAQDPDHPNSPG